MAKQCFSYLANRSISENTRLLPKVVLPNVYTHINFAISSC